MKWGLKIRNITYPGGWVTLDLLQCVTYGAGEGGGVKNGEFGCYVIIEWPLFLDRFSKNYQLYSLSYYIA